MLLYFVHLSIKIKRYDTISFNLLVRSGNDDRSNGKRIINFKKLFIMISASDMRKTAYNAPMVYNERLVLLTQILMLNSVADGNIWSVDLTDWNDYVVEVLQEAGYYLSLNADGKTMKVSWNIIPSGK